MDVSRVTSSAVRSVQGHGSHHQLSISDMLNKMASGIDRAVASGKLSADQASALKEVLDSISQTLEQDPTGSSLSADQRKEIRKELHDIGKQLQAALGQSGGTQESDRGSAASFFSDILAAMKSRGSGRQTSSIDMLQALQRSGGLESATGDNAVQPSGGSSTATTGARGASNVAFSLYVSQIQVNAQYTSQGSFSFSASSSQSLISMMA